MKITWMERATTVAIAIALGGCSIKTFALKSVANAMSGTGTVYARDDDPELVRDAIPFALKTMESLADALPDHEGIRIALARSCASLAVGFFEVDAEHMADKDVARSLPLVRRTRRLLLRGREYALQGLEIRAKGARKAFEGNDEAAQKAVLGKLGKSDVELLYWLGASWAAAISNAKDDVNLIAELPRVGLILDRALVLDEAYDEGSLEELFILFDSARTVDQGGGPKKVMEHYKRALALSRNKKLGPHVSLAETVMVDSQNKKEFKRLLELVTAADVDENPNYRLVNILAQRRAQWLLSRTDELFAE